MNVNSSKYIYCVGIGGIGLSGLARILHWQGKTVSGSDLIASEITGGLLELGIDVKIGPPRASNIPENIDLVVHTTAIPIDHVEIESARNRGIRIISYPEALGQLTGGKFLITISGTHGKSTTTAFVSHLLRTAGWDPTTIVGSLVPEFGGNAQLGRSKYFVLEADEYNRAFLNYSPQVAIITNIERDHLDVYRDLNDLKTTFQKFLQQVKADGFVVANADDPVVKKIIPELDSKIVTYGIQSGDYRAKDIRYGTHVSFELDDFGAVSLTLPGKHNVYNALAMIATGLQLGIEAETIKTTLQNFIGLWRRFERVGSYEGNPIITDYAHHPTEIQVTLRAAKEAYPGKRILAVFQPHQRHRTQMLFQEFCDAFSDAGGIILSEIYEVAGREEENNSVSVQQMFDVMQMKGLNVQMARDLKETKDLIKKVIQPNDVVVVMGAGSIDQVARDLAQGEEYTAETTR
ncbi:MAG: UDP-N-acetylmuramate--L-alanine ligase [bacterium]|nr:UDP-N-acetylmuramate--L-alanine ligase [bacterium]